MESIYKIIYSLLEKEGGKTFHELFDFIKEKKMAHWQERMDKKSEKKIIELKMGELYSLLTIDGEFIKVEDNWVLTSTLTLDQIKSAKIKIPVI